MTDETPAPSKRTRKRVAAPEPADALPPAQERQPAAAPVGGAIPAVDVSSLRVERGGIAEATAGSVEVHLGGIGRLEADEVYVHWGGVGAGRADRMSVEFGSVGAAAAGDLRITQGFASNILARDAVVEQGIVRTLIAQRVTFTRPSAVLVMLAGQVSGEVRPLLDWRGALAAGAAFGLVSALVKVLRRRA
jgi:hypothetical protein